MTMPSAADVAATPAERAQAAALAIAIREAIADPTTAGEPTTVHVDYSNPRRGVWLTIWPNLPGLFLNKARRAYTHRLLPGWEYTPREMRTEMVEDLERLAATGERPKVATR